MDVLIAAEEYNQLLKCKEELDAIKGVKSSKEQELLKGCQLLEGYEGYRAEVYLDTENIETIGIGRNLEVYPLDPEELEDDGTYSHVNAVAWAYVKLAECRKDLVIRLPQVTMMPEDVRILLTDMAYNLGLSGLMKFKNMIASLKVDDYTQAAMDLQDSKYFNQTGQRALSHYRTLIKLGAK